ncbi:MAG: hypothetical protein ACOCX4_02190 [Planctomycetota bacterium]
MQWYALCALAFCCLVPLACEDPSPPATFRLEEDYTSPEGWTGRRIVRNGRTEQVMLDRLHGDGRTDYWAIYEEGRLRRELFDLDADEIIDVQARYDPDEGDLLSVERYTGTPAVCRVRIAYERRHRWEQALDRDGDGQVDLRFAWEGPPSMLTDLGASATTLTDAREVVPPRRWRLLAADDDRDGILETQPFPVAEPEEANVAVPRNAPAPQAEADAPSAEPASEIGSHDAPVLRTGAAPDAVPDSGTAAAIGTPAPPAPEPVPPARVTRPVARGSVEIVLEDEAAQRIDPDQPPAVPADPTVEGDAP